jgi:hypothetical protein
MLDTHDWEDAEEQPEEERPGWTPEAQAWYHRQLENNVLRSFLLEQPAYLEALGAASPNQSDPYRDGLERVTAHYLKRPPMVVWVDDSIYREGTFGGGYQLCPGAIRAALLRAVRDSLEEIRAKREAGQRYDKLRIEILLRAEQDGRLSPAPVEPAKSVLLARQAIRGGFADRGEP